MHSAQHMSCRHSAVHRCCVPLYALALLLQLQPGMCLMCALLLLLAQTRHMSVTTELRRQLQEGVETPVSLAAALRESDEARRYA